MNDSPPPSRPRPPSIPVFLLLPLPLLLGPAWHTAAQRCPQTCICDNSRRHVSCRHQNLSEVPDAIPEVGRARGCGGRRTWGSLSWHGSLGHGRAGEPGKVTLSL